jgi:hypothetical protein
MTTISANLNNLNDNIKSSLDYINTNTVLSSAIGILLVLYVTLAAPKLPKSYKTLFAHPLFKIIYIFLIAYLASNNPSLSLIIAIVLLLITIIIIIIQIKK